MQKCRILIGFYSIIIPCGNFLITSLFFFSLSLSPPIRCKHQTFRFEANIKCVHFDFIEVHYREVGAPQRERRFAGEKRITLSRVIARPIIQTVRVRTTPLFTRVCAHALMHDVARVRSTTRAMSKRECIGAPGQIGRRCSRFVLGFQNLV